MSLTSRCGHHCGIQTSGEVRIEGHCPGPCCHDSAALPAQSENKVTFERGAAA